MPETDDPCNTYDVISFNVKADSRIHNLSSERNELNFKRFPQIRPDMHAEKVQIWLIYFNEDVISRHTGTSLPSLH